MTTVKLSNEDIHALSAYTTVSAPFVLALEEIVTRHLEDAAARIDDLALALVADGANPVGHALTAAVLDRAAQLVRIGLGEDA